MTYWDKIISMALRYGAVFVSGYMASESVPTFNLLRTNPLPMELEQRKAICASKALACVLPILTAIYGLPSAITIMNVGRTKHGYLFTIFAVLDLTLFACFLASLFLGSSDIYLKPGFCDDNVRDGRLPIGPASFLFQVIGDMKGCDERKCYVETCRNLEVISYMTATLW